MKFEESINKAKDFLEKNKIFWSLFSCLFIIICFSAITIKTYAQSNNNESVPQIIKPEVSGDQKTEVSDSVSNEDEITFDIEGAVTTPGVYKIKNGSVVSDAIKMASGLTPDADKDRIAKEINQASVIGNNSKIYIFRNSDKGLSVVTTNGSTPASNVSSSVGSTATNSSTQSTTSAKINLNKATLQELDSLPKIGPAIAQRIIDWRNANGGFEVVEDIKKVKGIGDSLFDGIKDLIVVE